MLLLRLFQYWTLKFHSWGLDPRFRIMTIWASFPSYYVAYTLIVVSATYISIIQLLFVFSPSAFLSKLKTSQTDVLIGEQIYTTHISNSVPFLMLVILYPCFSSFTIISVLLFLEDKLVALKQHAFPITSEVMLFKENLQGVWSVEFTKCSLCYTTRNQRLRIKGQYFWPWPCH